MQQEFSHVGAKPRCCFHRKRRKLPKAAQLGSKTKETKSTTDLYDEVVLSSSEDGAPLLSHAHIDQESSYRSERSGHHPFKKSMYSSLIYDDAIRPNTGLARLA